MQQNNDGNRANMVSSCTKSQSVENHLIKRQRERNNSSYWTVKCSQNLFIGIDFKDSQDIPNKFLEK